MLISLDFYRQTPPKVPNFLKTLFRRKLVLWFLGSEILRNYWLSGVSRSLDAAQLSVLMPLPALRTKLEFLMEQQSSSMADSVTHHCLLHWRLGSSAGDSHVLQQNAHMVTSCFRSRSRCSAMVPGKFSSSSYFTGKAVLTSHDRCYGVLPLSPFTSHGQVTPVLIWAYLCGCGWVSLTLFRVLAWE
jgi:hypothetical protein